MTETLDTETLEVELCSWRSDMADTLTAWLLCTESSPPATAADAGLASGTPADTPTQLPLLAAAPAGAATGPADMEPPAAPELLDACCSW